LNPSLNTPRPWTLTVFVKDVAQANLLALDHVQSDVHDTNSPDEMAFNIGSGRATSVNALYDEMVKIIPTSIDAVHAQGRPGKSMESKLDITRVWDVLGFSPQVKLHDGLMQTVAWQKNVKGAQVKRVH